MRDVVIVSAARTPVGDFGGSLQTVPTYDLAALVLSEAVKRANLGPSLVNAVIMGQNVGKVLKKRGLSLDQIALIGP